MIAPTQIRKPENWQDFEKLCKKLWGQIWNCSSSIRRNGRSGQKQCGVDIYAIPDGEQEYWGIQCKGKDENLNSFLTHKEIDNEIKNAEEFQPPLKRLILATSGNKDSAIEEYIRKKDIENKRIGLFSIELACWGDIVDFLEENQETYNWYVNNCQYKDSSDIEVSFDEKQELKINPQYIRITKNYIVKPKVDFADIFSQITQQDLQRKILISTQMKYNDFLNPKRKVDYRWCTIPIKVRNIGSTVLEDYKVILVFESSKIDKIDDKFKYLNAGPLFDQSAVVLENNEREKSQEVFESTEYSNVIEFRPLKPILVQSDYKRFKVGIKPKDNVEEISVKWIFLSRNYKKEGELILKVFPNIEEKIERIETDSSRGNEIEIVPKIIED